MIYLLLIVRDILETQDTVILMLSARNIIGKLKEEKTFRVTSCKLWNMLPLSIRKEKSIKALKRNLWKKIFNEQCSTGHFSSL